MLKQSWRILISFAVATLLLTSSGWNDCFVGLPKPALEPSISEAQLDIPWLNLQQFPTFAWPAAEPTQKSLGGRSDYESLPRHFDKDRLWAFFDQRRPELAARWAEIVSVLGPAWLTWRREEELPEDQRTRGRVLCDGLAQLGPVFVKIGQTLSQRPDLIGKDAADALKRLQQKNEAFSSEEAFSIILADLNHNGPLVPGGFTAPGGNPDSVPLFASITQEPIAAASLGQVYKAMTLDGRKVAVKVQRPGAFRQVALDWTCWSLGLSALGLYWGASKDLSLIADEVAEGIFKELDYHNEASNAALFLKRHKFLPFITAPQWLPEYSGKLGETRVLTLEWIQGRSLGDVTDPDERVRMVDMAVEACVSSLIFTGFVHADPHEGNFMVTDDGRLAFLDFGLMGHVEPRIMEGFACGIQHLLSGNWLALARVFQDVEFIPKPADGGFKRVVDSTARVFEYEPCSDDEFAAALQKQMESEEGGLTRFGALATALTKLSTRYHMQSPPYIILFIRTFLTLEGIAAVARPGFNIYEASLPYALRRALSPKTLQAVKAMRENVISDTGLLRWERVQALLADSVDSPSTDSSESKQDTSGYMNALTQVLSATEGRALRRLIADVDSVALLRTLAVGPEAASIRDTGVKELSSSLRKFPRTFLKRWTSHSKTSSHVQKIPAWEKMPSTVAYQKRQIAKRKTVFRVVTWLHFKRAVTPSAAFGLVPLTAMLVFVSRLLIGTSLRLTGVHTAAQKLKQWFTRRGSRATEVNPKLVCAVTSSSCNEAPGS